MVDQENPTNQFHPYQPPDVIPLSDRPAASGLEGMLSKIGLENIDVRGSVEKARGYARRHPGRVLAGLAALAIGLGLLAKRKR